MLAWWVLQSHSIIIHMSMNCTCFRWMIKKKTSATCRPTRGGGSCSRELIPSRRKWPKNKQRGEPFYIRLFSHPLAFLVFHPPPPVLLFRWVLCMDMWGWGCTGNTFVISSYNVAVILWIENVHTGTWSSDSEDQVSLVDKSNLFSGCRLSVLI